MSSLRKSLSVFFLMLVSFGASVSAQSLEIIPQATNPEQVKADVTSVAASGGDVWNQYNSIVAEKRSLSDQLSSGIMDWTTVLDYFARFIKYLSQLGIFV
jgi:hypothetical protein